MDFDQFRNSLAGGTLPRALPVSLRALWHEARGNWPRAHEIVAADNGKAAARVHAYLHRKEGDSGNADYLYARAGAKHPRGGLDAEWEALVREFLGKQ